MRRTTWCFVALVSAVSLDCATLAPIAANTCGNGVVDAATEDCDSFPAGACGAPGDGVKACRLTCDRKVTTSCPAGWGCSVEGFCRQATGNLASAGAPLSAGAAALIGGDFDGDGRVDIVGAPPYKSGGNSRVHFFDADANLATTASVQIPISLPVIKDFNRDGIEDLGFSVSGVGIGGFGALSGRRDRTFSPILFPAITIEKMLARPSVIHTTDQTALPGFNRSCAIAVTQVPDGNRLHSFCGDTIAGKEELDLPIPAGPGAVIGEVKTGIINTPNLVVGPASTICGEVVGGYNVGEQGKLFIASPCDIVQTGVAPASFEVRFNSKKNPVEMNVPGRLLEPPVLADITYDGYDDVFVHTTNGVYVALNKTGTLQPFVELKTVPPWTTLATDASFNEMPLAAIDLNGDNRVDLIFPSGVLMSRVSAMTGDAGSTSSILSPRPRDGEVWADVRTGNFNGDQLPDVVARYPDSLDVEMLANVGGGLFTKYTVRSDQAVRELVNGDFDGDLIQDVAFLQSPRRFDDPSGSGEIGLVIAYGKAAGGPESSQVIGRFTNARAITPLHEAESGLDNLAVTETLPSPNGLPTTAITVIFGSGGRQPIAPLFMRDEDAKPPYDKTGPLRRGKTRFWVPVVLAAGALQTPGTIDLISIATGLTIDFATQPPAFLTPFPTAVWLAPNNPAAGGGLGSFMEVSRITDFVAGLDQALVKQSILESVIVATIGDIDSPPNGLDEVVNLAQTPGGDSGVYIVRASNREDRPEVTLKLPNVNVSGGDPIELADLNADGLPDLVTLTTSSKKRKVLVLLNDGKGSFVNTPLEIDIPSGPEAQESENPLAFAHFISGVRADTNKAQQVMAVITSTRLFIATLKPDASGFDLEDKTGLLASGDTKSSATARMTSITAGDFDGDGVQDIAVADSGSIRILRQLPRIK